MKKYRLKHGKNFVRRMKFVLRKGLITYGVFYFMDTGMEYQPGDHTILGGIVAGSDNIA